MKKLLLTLFILAQILNPALASDRAYCTREDGCFMDGRGQIPEYARIAPPNEDKIPNSSHPTKTVEAWDPYYQMNKMGRRPIGRCTRKVYGYNIYASTRRARPYTREEYMDVWCTGEKNYKRGTCSQGNYNLVYFRVRDWAFGVSSAPWKNRGSGKQWGLVLMCDEIGLDAPHMHDAKQWSELMNIPIHFVTIDSYIPVDWII